MKITKGMESIKGIIHSKQCPMCKYKADDVLYDQGWNGKFMFHFKETHGLDPQIVIDILRMIIRKVDHEYI